MRKRIGVFIGEIAQDYQKIIAKNVVEQANRLDYDVVLICSYGSYNEDVLYAYGEKSCIYLPDCSTFDGIIVTEDVFDIQGMPDELYKILMETAKCPVVYLRTSREGCYSIQTENKASIESVVRHFTDVHGFTDICYMSGQKGMDDAKERLNGYLSVMAEKGIEVTEHMIFHGDYWRFKGKEAIDWFMEGRDTYPQAIVCANDYMAFSICDELEMRGVRIPEDVCVSGFDFLDEAKLNTPSLTSLEVDFSEMAKRAVDLIDHVNRWESEEKLQYIEAKLRLNRSCGCGKQCSIESMMDRMERMQQHIDDTKNSFLSVTDYQDAFDFDEYMDVANRYRRFLRSDQVYFCFRDEEECGFDAVENYNLFTRRMVLRRIFSEKEAAEKVNVSFSRKQILPDRFWSQEEFNNFCVFTIHFKDRVYGYAVAKLPSDGRWFDICTQGYFMNLANAIENSEAHKKMEQLEAIRSMYQKDALTGILNRRGFDKLFQESYASSKADGSTIALASIDMDNLKMINDTFGHAEGDKAIIILAKALSSTMKEGDFCARIGGDEFAAVIHITYEGRATEFKQELRDALKRESQASKDYEVGASIGICESTEQSAPSLVACIQLADGRMYEDKRSRKAGRQ